ncbi:unnamed protein product [Haemonchus placei]|uniref:DUF167 domain-containing protein n=1 Tax=Haemonchus placei TaxID=6290 RepID=A0A3P7WQ41_HAEPC|nr:unnamed protein product [Haemonchus placei]
MSRACLTGCNLPSFALPPTWKNFFPDVGDDEVGVAIAAPPREGEANEELISYMRGVLGLKKSELVLDKGGKSRSKTLLITSSRISSDEVVAKLKAAAEN